MNLILFVFRILIFVVSSLPLHFAVKILKGKTDLIKTVLVNLITGIIISYIYSQFRIFGGLIAFFLLIWIYHEIFRLKWYKAMIVWLVQLIILVVFYFLMFLLSVLLGLTIFVGVF
jgi:hypothetical protein